MERRLLWLHEGPRKLRPGRDRAIARRLEGSIGATRFDEDLPGLDPERDLIIVVGGDGTLHHAIQYIASVVGVDCAWPRMAFVPSGTANDAARALAALTGRDHSSIEQLQQAVRRGDAGTAGDLGQVDFADQTRYFVNFAALGSPSDWVRIAESRWMRPIKRFGGLICYSLCSLAVILRKPTVRLTTEVCGEVDDEHVFAWFAANARYLGGGLDLGEDVRLDSGLLGLLRVRAGTRRSLVGLLTDVRRGRGPRPTIAEAATVRVPAGADLVLDGELVPLSRTTETVLGVSVRHAQIRWL